MKKRILNEVQGSYTSPLVVPSAETCPVDAGVNTGEHGIVLPTSQWHKGAIEPTFGCWGRAPFWTVSHSPLPLASKLDQSWQKADQWAESFHICYIGVSCGVERASHLGLPRQNFWWGSLSILSNISLQGYVDSVLMTRERRCAYLGNITVFNHKLLFQSDHY